MNDSSKLYPNISKLNIFSLPIVILVDGLQPPDIIMRMRADMDGHGTTSLVIFYTRVWIMFMVLSMVVSDTC